QPYADCLLIPALPALWRRVPPRAPRTSRRCREFFAAASRARQRLALDQGKARPAVTIAPRYDVAIIGAGQAGLPLANGLAQKGKRVAILERKHLGGSCINFGCTPTKAAIASARLAHLARRGREFGLRIPEVTVDFAAVIERARNVAAASRNNLEQWLGSVENPTLLRGQGRLAGRAADGFHIRAGETELTAGDVVLNTGTRSVFPPIDGLADIAVIHAGNW